MLRFEDGKYFAYESVGEFRSAGVWVHPTRAIKSYELILVKEGTVYIKEGETEYVLNSGDMILLSPDIIHGGYRESEMKTSFYWFHFQTDLALPFKTASSEENYDIRHFLKKLLNITNGGCFSQNTADSLGFLIFDELSKTKKQGSASVQNIMEYIRINRNKDISVASIAQEFGYNADYVGKLFKKHTNLSLKQYISQKRLEYAKELLFTTSFTIKEIARVIGYENEKLFIKFFIYHEKITPTAYRNLYIHTHLNNK